jgi:hypothetical protein
MSDLGVSVEWRRAFDWVEAELGGKVVRAERQPRWRPAWFLDVDSSEGTLPVYFRGERGESDHGVYSLEHEMRVLQLLEANGVPVPHVYGFCPEPRGIVMERSPGRVNLATAENEAERASVLREYVEILARMHRIDLDRVEALGLRRPSNSRELGLADFDGWVRAYRRRKVRAEPIVEFLVRWVECNVPEQRDRAALICADSGQFLFEAGRVTALIDLELATLGDPMADLAGMLSRDLSEPMGDLTEAFRHYERVSGDALDTRAIDFHAVRFCAVTPLAVAHLVAAPPPGVDWVQYLCWYSVWLRGPLEIIAARAGVTLDAVQAPEPVDTRHSAGHVALGAMLGADDSGDAFAGYQRGAAARVAEYLRRAERLGPRLEAEQLDEVGALLGVRPSDWSAADAALERYVEECDPDSAPDLVHLMHRSLQRLEIVLSPVMRELEGARMQIVG